MNVVQCVPNFSEGRDLNKINRIINSLKKFHGFKIVDVNIDPSYNRTVVTLLGDLDKIKIALVDFTNSILNEIDLRFQNGEHPRIGALDIIPFIPIKNISMDECVNASIDLAKILSDKFSIPVYLYEKSAKDSSKINLENIRRGEFEGLHDKMKSPLWKPDFGPSSPHKTFGAMAIGARNPLIAYNIDIETTNINIANSIAKKIRHSSGGFRYVKAKGIFLSHRNICQVSINITDFKKNSMYTIFETVKTEAKRYDLHINACEIIGLTPLENLLDSIFYYTKSNNISKDFSIYISLLEKFIGLYGFNTNNIIENHL